MQSEVLHTGHDGEEEEGEDLGQVGGAGEEGELLDGVGLAEHALHQVMVEVAGEEPGGGVQGYAHLPDIFLRSEISNGGCGYKIEL